MGLTGDIEKLDAFAGNLRYLAHDGRGLTRAAMSAARLLSEFVSEQEREPTGRPWPALALSTLRRRRPGPKLLRIYRSRIWRLLGVGRFGVENPNKPHDIYHTKGTWKMPRRADLPVMAGGERAYGRVMHEAIGETLAERLGVKR